MRRKQELQVSFAADGEPIGADVVCLGVGREQFALDAEFSHASGECGRPRLGQGIHVKCKFGRGPLHGDAHASSSVEESVDGVDGMIVLCYGTVEYHAGNFQFSLVLRKYHVLHYDSRAVSLSSDALNLLLHLLNGKILGDKSFEVGLFGKSYVGQCDARLGVEFICEENGFLLVDMCA